MHATYSAMPAPLNAAQICSVGRAWPDNPRMIANGFRNLGLLGRAALGAALLVAGVLLTGCASRAVSIDGTQQRGQARSADGSGEAAMNAELAEVKRAYAALQQQLARAEVGAELGAEAAAGGGAADLQIDWGREAADGEGDTATVAMASVAPRVQQVAEVALQPLGDAAAVAAAPDDLADLVARATRLLASGAAYGGGARIDRGLAAVGLSMVDPERRFPTELLGELSVEERDRVERFQRVVSRVGDGLMRGDGAALANAEASVLDIASEDPMVRIAGLHLCKRVSGFGVFDPFPGTQFTAGQAHRMIVYAEVEDFTAKKVTADGADVVGATAAADERFEVRLSQEVILFNDADGLVVWRDGPREIKDLSRRKRRDFWVVQMITLPANLGTGKYRLKVRITDEYGDAVDERSELLTLVADASATPRPAADASADPVSSSAALPGEEADEPESAAEALRVIRGLMK